MVSVLLMGKRRRRRRVRGSAGGKGTHSPGECTNKKRLEDEKHHVMERKSGGDGEGRGGRWRGGNGDL